MLSGGTRRRDLFKSSLVRYCADQTAKIREHACVKIVCCAGYDWVGRGGRLIADVCALLPREAVACKRGPALPVQDDCDRVPGDDTHDREHRCSNLVARPTSTLTVLCTISPFMVRFGARLPRAPANLLYKPCLLACRPNWQGWSKYIKISRYLGNCGPASSAFTLARFGGWG